jgi:magnesium transporter
MNFENMPELHAVWGYPILLVAMILVAIVMVFYFRRKGWIGSAGCGDRDDSDT